MKIQGFFCERGFAVPKHLPDRTKENANSRDKKGVF